MALREGYLTKEGHAAHTWKRRWFILEHGVLQYFESPESATPLGTILLAGATIRDPKHKRGNRPAFRLDTSADTAREQKSKMHAKYLLSGEDAAESQVWREALLEHIQLHTRADGAAAAADEAPAKAPAEAPAEAPSAETKEEPPAAAVVDPHAEKEAELDRLEREGLRVHVPDGAPAPTDMAVEACGRTLKVAVPPGVQPGGSFHMRLPPSLFKLERAKLATARETPDAPSSAPDFLPAELRNAAERNAAAAPKPHAPGRGDYTSRGFYVSSQNPHATPRGGGGGGDSDSGGGGGGGGGGTKSITPEGHVAVTSSEGHVRIFSSAGQPLLELPLEVYSGAAERTIAALREEMQRVGLDPDAAYGGGGRQLWHQPPPESGAIPSGLTAHAANAWPAPKEGAPSADTAGTPRGERREPAPVAVNASAPSAVPTIFQERERPEVPRPANYDKLEEERSTVHTHGEQAYSRDRDAEPAYGSHRQATAAAESRLPPGLAQWVLRWVQTTTHADAPADTPPLEALHQLLRSGEVLLQLLGALETARQSGDKSPPQQQEPPSEALDETSVAAARDECVQGASSCRKLPAAMGGVAFQHADRIERFLRGAQRLGLPKVSLFEVPALLEAADMPAVVVCLSGLAKCAGTAPEN